VLVAYSKFWPPQGMPHEEGIRAFEKVQELTAPIRNEITNCVAISPVHAAFDMVIPVAIVLVLAHEEQSNGHHNARLDTASENRAKKEN